MLLPVLGIAYVSWHIWCLLPLPASFRVFAIFSLIASFGLLFLNFNRVTDRMPMWLARWNYDIGTSSLFILLYLVIIFLVLDLGRLIHIIPRQALYNNVYTSIIITIAMFVTFLWGNIRYQNKQRVELTLKTEKHLAYGSLNLLMINTAIPMLFAYGRHRSKEVLCDRAFDFLEQLKAENNYIIRMWLQVGLPVQTAGDSQALIQLKKEYCDKKDCLRCRFGYEYLKR